MTGARRRRIALVWLATATALLACAGPEYGDFDALDGTGEPCVPRCDGRSCGSDGCGGDCGRCAPGHGCDALGACVVTVCGNGKVEPGETCDPGDSCLSWCDDGIACTVDELVGTAATCDVQCTFTAISVCQAGDRCCPAGCSAATDPDCSASCGDGVVDALETCDPPASCPSACDDGDACTVDTRLGEASSCYVECVSTAITACVTGDGCCPAGCDPARDGDCVAQCGNGLIEPGEACDGDCPAFCASNVCTGARKLGSAATCDARCVYEEVVACGPSDGCCPGACQPGSDADCSPTCGNGVVDAGEACDGNCPSSCDDGNACTLDQRAGDAASCSATCRHEGISQCASGDGCCPAGCTVGNDADCSIDCHAPASWPASWSADEEEVIALVNQARAAGADCGGTAVPPVGPVAMDAAAREAARCHSVDMAVNNFFAHTGSDGSDFSTRLARAGFGGWPVGENIAAGSSNAASTVSQWLNSPGHCVNLMSANANVMGIGHVYEPDGQGWSQLWTMVIGAR